MKKKKKLFELDIVRVFSALGIIFYHWTVSLNFNGLIPFQGINAIGGGEVSVILFFLLSGFVLFYNYGNNLSIKTYLYKRWKAIFPIFYVVYFFFFIQYSLDAGTVYGGPDRLSILFTVFALDGYVSLFNIPTWYLIGEGFLGSIIIMYISFICFALLIKKFRLAGVVIPLILIGICIFENVSGIYKSCNFVGSPLQYIGTDLFIFFLGMLLAKFGKSIISNGKFLYIIIPLIVLITCVNLHFMNEVREIIFSIVFFIFLSYVGKLISRFNGLKLFISNLANLTFIVFLLHHRIITKVVGLFNPITYKSSFIYLILTIFVIFLLAKAFDLFTKGLLSLSFFKSLDKKFL